jgi:hypothetical protein
MTDRKYTIAKAGQFELRADPADQMTPCELHYRGEKVLEFYSSELVDLTFTLQRAGIVLGEPFGISLPAESRRIR